MGKAASIRQFLLDNLLSHDIFFKRERESLKERKL